MVVGGRLYLRDSLGGGRWLHAVALGERLTRLVGLNPRTVSMHFLEEADMRAMLESVGFAVDGVQASGLTNRFWACTRKH